MSDQLPTAPLIERFQGGLRANADPRVLAERLLRGSELALEAARRDAADAMLACEELSERILALEAELVQARQEPELLQGLLAVERRARRLAEQHAYSERARREELQQELDAEREEDQADPEFDDSAEAEARRRELESDAIFLRREADELGHLLGSAQRARERAEHRVAELTAALERAEHQAAPAPAERHAVPEPAERHAVPEPASRPSPAPSVSDGLAREFAVAGRPVQPSPPPAPGPALGAPDPRLELERRMALARSEDRSARLERELSEQIGRSSRAYDAIEELRTRLGAIGGWSAGSPEPAPAAQPVPAVAQPVPAVAQPAPVAQPEPAVAQPEPVSEPARPAVAVEPERFNAALTRLREAVPAEARAPDPAPPAGPAVAPGPSPAGPPIAWLPAVFHRLAREDPEAAGQLVLELLPLQRTVYAEPIAYDLVLPGQTCIRLTASDDGLQLELGEPRPPSQVSFAVIGDPAGLARMLAAGRVGRRLRRGLPKVTGDRRGLQALDALVRAPLSLGQLHDAGVRLEPRLALQVVARMIAPGWTTGSRFAIGYGPAGGEPVVYLEIADGRPVRVSEAVEPALVAGTITGEPESLLALLDRGEPGAEEFSGQRPQLAKVMSWVKRAQSG